MKSKQIYNYLIKLIKENYSTRDYKLPSETYLCKEHNVSRGTVRTVLAKLRSKNIIYSIHGKGHFISSQEKLNSFAVINSRWMNGQDNISIKIEEIKKYNDAIFSSSNEEYYYIKRHKYANKKISEVVHTFLNSNYFDITNTNLITRSISEFIKKNSSYLINLNCRTKIIRNNIIDNNEEFITCSIYSYYDEDENLIAISHYYLPISLFHIEYNKLI